MLTMKKMLASLSNAKKSVTPVSVILLLNIIVPPCALGPTVQKFLAINQSKRMAPIKVIFMNCKNSS
jgi:hypothetical protein